MKLTDAFRARNRPTLDGGSKEATVTEIPIRRYDRLGEERVLAELPKHSQLELATIEAYEQSHKARPKVLNKLRYLRGPEPIPGYDELSPDEISAALEGADLDTLGAVRSYERKFHRRDPVLQELNRVRSRR